MARLVHLKVLIGLLLALACAGGASLGGLWKQKGAVQARAVDIRHPVQSAVALFRSKWFVIGWVAAAIAWFLHVGALAMAPLSLAQAVISGGLVLLGVLAERFFGFSLTSRQWLGLGALAAGMAVLAATAHAEKNHSKYALLAIAAFEIGGVGLGVAFAVTCRLRRWADQHGVLLGVAAGLWFGVADVSIKAATGGTYPLLGLLAPWVVIGILAGVGGFYASARSLQIGDAVGVIAATASAANVFGIVGGLVVFGDRLGSDAPTVIGRLAAFVLVVVAAALIPAPVRAHGAVRRDARESEQRELAVSGSSGGP